MKILRWEFSERFSRYVEWFRSQSQKRIRFYYMDEHPNPAFHSRPAMVDVQNTQAKVYIHRNSSERLAEENAAHELTHLALMDLGYCYPVLTDQKGQDWQQVADGILSWTADVLIDAKLEEFGYDNKEYQNMVWENTMKHLELYPQESKPGAEEIFNALGYFYCYKSVDQSQWQAMQESYEKVDPTAYHLGETIIQLSEEQEYDDSPGYCRFLIKIRDAMGLMGMIGILNPKTRETF